MRILFVTALYLPYAGGLEILADQCALELRQRGHDVSVLTSCDIGETAGSDHVNGTLVRRLDVHGVIERRDFAGILRVQRETCELVNDLKPDVIHGHDAFASLWLYLRATRGPRPPIVLTLHNIMSEQFAETGSELPGLQTVLRDVDWVTGVSSDVLHDLRQIEPSIAHRSSVTSNGIRPPSHEVDPVRDGPARLVCIGRLVPQKGFDRAIDATATLIDRGHDVRLTIVGDGPLRAELVSRADALGIGARVDFTGEVAHDRIPGFLREATTVVMPSRYEGLPLVALEAGWMARPVVGMAVPGLSQAVVHDETGVLVHDAAGLAGAIEELLEDRARARALGAAARARVEQSFSLSTCVDHYVDVYERLATIRGSRERW